MRTTLTALTFLAAAALASTATGETFTEIELGDQIQGTIPDADPVVVPFMGLRDTLATFQVTTAAAGALPTVTLLTPDRLLVPTEQATKTDKKGKKVTVKKLPLPASGRYFLLISAGIPTDFTLKTKGKLLAKVTEAVPISVAATHDRPFAALPGTLLTVKMKQAKLSALSPLIVAVLEPDGDEVDLSRYKRKTTETLDSISKIRLDAFGDFTIQLGTQEGSAGDLGNLKFKAKHPKPRRSKLVVADLRVDPFVDGFSATQAFDNQTLAAVTVTGSFFRKGVELTLELQTEDDVTLVPTVETRQSHTRISASFDFRNDDLGPFPTRVMGD